MQQFVLKENVRDQIAGRKVIAALFYTFNFDPEFFENYVMPLLVPGRDFRDEIIYNKILWRRCLKEGAIPPITVYCDFFAKHNTKAPSLGYSINCLRLVAASGYISNFHPKHIFLLVETEEGIQSLLMYTGSSNLTVAGWCENFEGMAMREFVKDNVAPKTAKTNQLQDLIENIAGLKSSDRKLSEAESEIYQFLRYVDFDTDNYFNSIDWSFKEFLEERVFSRDEIREMEIISPYFSEDAGLLHYLKREKKIPKVKCLIPMSRHYEIQLKKEVFLRLRDDGLT